MARKLKIGFIASGTDVAQSAFGRLSARYGGVAQQDADVIVALGGGMPWYLQLLGRQRVRAPAPFACAESLP